VGLVGGACDAREGKGEVERVRKGRVGRKR